MHFFCKCKEKKASYIKNVLTCFTIRNTSMFCQVTRIVVELQVLSSIDVMSFDLSAPVRTSSVLEVVDRELQSPGAVEKLTASGGNFEEFHYLRRFPWVDIHQGSSVKVKVERRLNVNSGANLSEASDRGIYNGNIRMGNMHVLRPRVRYMGAEKNVKRGPSPFSDSKIQ